MQFFFYYYFFLIIIRMEQLRQQNAQERSLARILGEKNITLDLGKIREPKEDRKMKVTLSTM